MMCRCFLSCFPVKIHAASAGWARAVAIFTTDDGPDHQRPQAVTGLGAHPGPDRAGWNVRTDVDGVASIRFPWRSPAEGQGDLGISYGVR